MKITRKIKFKKKPYNFKGNTFIDLSYSVISDKHLYEQFTRICEHNNAQLIKIDNSSYTNEVVVKIRCDKMSWNNIRIELFDSIGEYIDKVVM